MYFDLLLSSAGQPRIQEPLQTLKFGSCLEYDRRDRLTVHTAVPADDAFTPPLTNHTHNMRIAIQLTHLLIRIDDGCAQRLEYASHRRLSGTNPTGQSDDRLFARWFHCRQVSTTKRSKKDRSIGCHRSLGVIAQPKNTDTSWHHPSPEADRANNSSNLPKPRKIRSQQNGVANCDRHISPLSQPGCPTIHGSNATVT